MRSVGPSSGRIAGRERSEHRRQICAENVQGIQVPGDPFLQLAQAQAGDAAGFFRSHPPLEQRSEGVDMAIDQISQQIQLIAT
jgi:hypothetical protein